jgi:hypothetical protein
MLGFKKNSIKKAPKDEDYFIYTEKNRRRNSKKKKYTSAGAWTVK